MVNFFRGGDYYIYVIFIIEGWLEFLIDFIVRNWSIVMIFVIDVIDKEIF